MSLLPSWMSDLAIICSITGLIVTIFLYLEARVIKKSFLRRARLPQVLKELSTTSNKFSKCLKNWDDEQKEGIHQLFIANELLENIMPKLPDNERKKVSTFVSTLKVKRFFVFRTPVTSADENKAWELYSGLSAVVTALKQLEKDSKWD